MEQSGKTLADGTKSRKKTGNKWFETQDQIAYYPEFDKEKIVYPDIYRNPSFTVVTNNFYLINTCYFIPTEKTWLCGVLNSKTVEWYYSRLANTLGGGGSRGFSIFMKQIHVPNIDSDRKTLITNLVNEILAAKVQPQTLIPLTLKMRLIDCLRLYDLTDDEIAIVEGSV